MVTQGAFGNLVNRYRAVLSKCRLINVFGSLAVASMMVMGGAASVQAVEYRPDGQYAEGAEELRTSTLENVQDGVLVGFGENHQPGAFASVTLDPEGGFSGLVIQGFRSGSETESLTLTGLNDDKNFVSFNGEASSIMLRGTSLTLGDEGFTGEKSLKSIILSDASNGPASYVKVVGSSNEASTVNVGGDIVSQLTTANTGLEARNVTLNVAGDISVQSVYARRDSVINAAGDITAGAAFEVTKGSAVYSGGSITSNRLNLNDGSITAAEDFMLRATNSAETMANGSIIVGGDITIGENERKSLVQSEGGTLTLSAANGTIAADTITATNVIAGQLTAEAVNVGGGLLSLTGVGGGSSVGSMSVNDSVFSLGAGTQLDAGSLAINDAVINLDHDVDVSVDTLTGSGTVNLAADLKDGESAGSLTAGTADAALNVNLTGVTSDDITAEQAKELMDNVSAADGELTLTGNVEEGLVNGALTIGPDGSVVMGKNHVMESALEIASITSVSLDRILNNDIRKRMGDLRSVSGESGVWMRWDGGRLKGDSGLTNDFNTVQVGVDTMTGWDNVRVGLAASFTYGDGDHSRGSSEMEGVAVAGYGVWMADNGMFADVIARLGSFDTDVNLAGHKGNIDSMVASLSGEFGWRFDLYDQFYVEPQVELAYTYVDGDKFSLGSARYDVDDTDSLIGRAGISAGWKLPGDRGDVYARASVVQQFLGDAKISGRTNGMMNIYEIDGEDTWFEYGIGTNLRLTESASVWADLERTEGAQIDEEWRGTVGVRYSF